jgi:hypothetical protein
MATNQHDSSEEAAKQISSIEDRAASYFLSLHAISGDYGQLAVRSALVLNGGAIFAMPAFFAAIQSESEIHQSLNGIVFSATTYVLGIIASALCSFVAYANYQAAAEEFMEEAQLQILEIQERFDDVTFHRNQPWRALNREEKRKRISLLSKFGSWTTWIGVGLGFSAYFLFCLGCFIAARTLLA